MRADSNILLRAILGKTSDRTYQVPKIDPITHALEFIAEPHAMIHHEHSFEYTSYCDQSINHVWDIQFTTEDSLEIPHLTLEFDVESETLWHFYENVNIILAGTAVVPVNHHRGSAQPAELGIAYITNTTIGNANADTVVAGATVLSEGIAGSGKKVGGEGPARHEWPLSANETYCLRFIATAAGWVSWHLDWYEKAPEGN